MKLTFTTELRSKMICSLLMRRGRRGDRKLLKPCLKKLGRKVDVVVGDGGFNSEPNHSFIRKELKALSIIKPRDLKVPIHRMKGRYRKNMRRLWHH